MARPLCFTQCETMRTSVIASLRATICLAMLAAVPVQAAPVRPSDDQFVLLDSAVHATAMHQKLRALQSGLDSDPTNIASAIALSRAAIEAGRNLGDPRFYGQAQAALVPWWNADDAPEEVVILRATIRQAFHDFKPALADLDDVIARSPQAIQARFSRAFIRMVTGDLPGGKEDCDAIRAQRAAVVREICLARLGALSGNNTGSFVQLQRVRQRMAGSNPALDEFAAVVLAEIAVSLGDNAAAEALYRDATADTTADAATLAAYADVLLAAQRPQDALALLENRGEADILVLRRAIAGKQLNDPRLKEWSDILSERFAAAAASNNRVHLREEARFKLEVQGDVQAAVTLAAANWETQKEPADAELVLSAALAADQPAMAAPVRQYMKDSGITDARLTPLLEKLAAQDAIK
jgi:tetratricopeptide (TPR) repeat protein